MRDQTLVGCAAEAERGRDARSVGGADVERARVRALDEQPPSAGPDHERHGRVRLVVAALEVRDLDLHRPQLAPVVDVVEVFSEPVERLALGRCRADAKPRDAGRVLGDEHEAKGPLALELQREGAPRATGVLEREDDALAARGRAHDAGCLMKGDAGRREVPRHLGQQRVRVVARLVADLVDDAQREGRAVERRQQLIAAAQLERKRHDVDRQRVRPVAEREHARRGLDRLLVAPLLRRERREQEAEPSPLHRRARASYSRSGRPCASGTLPISIMIPSMNDQIPPMQMNEVSSCATPMPM